LSLLQKKIVKYHGQIVKISDPKKLDNMILTEKSISILEKL